MSTPRPQRRRAALGFTLLELMIVIAVIAILAAIVIPNLLAARMRANETAAISILRTISTAQAQFQKSGRADEDADGMGEYGYLGELAGKVGVRGGSMKVPTDVSASMGNVTPNGEVNRHGYMFRIYLVSGAGVGQREAALGGIAPGVLSADAGEVHWVAYAWPSEYAKSGSRTFFINQRGDILQTEDPTQSGANTTRIEAGSAFLTVDPTRMTALPAIGTVAADGNFWRTVQ